MESVDDYLSALKKLRRNVDSGVLARRVTGKQWRAAHLPIFCMLRGAPADTIQKESNVFIGRKTRTPLASNTENMS